MTTLRSASKTFRVMRLYASLMRTGKVVVVLGATLFLSTFLFLFPSLRPHWIEHLAVASTASDVTAPDYGRQAPSKETTSPAPAPCRRSLQFAAGRLPVTALASVQGSGNTWMRHLLQQLTGIYTGSVYSRRGDPELWAKGYYGEGISNGSVIAVKTHGVPSPRPIFQRAIVLIRNPFDAMFADFNRRASASHVGIAPAPAYFEYWNTFSQEYATRWKTFHQKWAQFKGPVLFVNFDDLVHSLNSTVEKLAVFLRHPALAMDVQCALSGSTGDAKRGQVSFHKLDVFSRRLTQLVHYKIREVQALLKNRFPETATAIGQWRKNSTLRRLTWRPLPPNIMR